MSPLDGMVIRHNKTGGYQMVQYMTQHQILDEIYTQSVRASIQTFLHFIFCISCLVENCVVLGLDIGLLCLGS